MRQDVHAIAPHYNASLLVDEAHKQLNGSLNKEKALQALCSVIKRHNLASEIGIRLLHRHNDISSGELMVEDVEVGSDKVLTLTTRPLGVEAITNSEIHPNSWKFTDGSYVPFEFSAKRVLADIVSPETRRACFEDMADVLKQFGVEEWLGPCVNLSPAFEAYKPNANSILSEVSDEDARHNVVRYVDQAEIDPGKTIETSWSVSLSPEGTSPNRVCTRVCQILPDGRHQGTFVHRPSADATEPAPMRVCTRVCQTLPDGRHQGTFIHRRDERV
jgi:hypothetical protein